MRIRNALTVLALGSGLLLNTACRTTDSDGGGSEPVPEDELAAVIADVVCTLLFECECTTSHSDEMTCDTAFVDGFTDALAQGNAAMLTYDADCAGAWIGQFQGYQCDPFSSGGDYECSVCQVFHGEGQIGDSCVAYQLGSFPYAMYGTDCAQGLDCDGSNCYDPCETEDYPGEGEPCPDYICDTGLFCPEGTMVCTDLPGNGEECPDYVCEADLGCNPETMMCEPLPGNGEDCVAQCVAGHYCNSDLVCAPYPGEGEDCMETFQCQEGFDCFEPDYICTAQDSAICAYG